MILTGFLLLLTGVLLAFLMVIKLLGSSFLLCFLSYLLMLGGLILGFIGIAKKWRDQK
ncbi:MAG: hypothetical protein GX878_06150 [Firmicutes bacterium]|nr:hypothetical protein [Bacillota bacterium]